MSESDPDRSGPLALAGEDLDDVPECWRNEISECLESSQEDSDKVDEAEACKTSSDDEESDDPHPHGGSRNLSVHGKQHTQMTHCPPAHLVWSGWYLAALAAVQSLRCSRRKMASGSVECGV